MKSSTAPGIRAFIARELPRTLLVAMGITMVALPSWSAPPTSPIRSAPSPSLTTQFTYTATVSRPDSAHSLSLWLPLPSDSPLQTVTDVKVDSVAEHRITREPTYGNRMIYVHSVNGPNPISVSVTFTVKRLRANPLEERRAVELTGSIPRTGSARLLAADSVVPVGGRYAEMASEVTSGKASVLDRMRAIYEHTVAMMKYDYKKESPKYAQGDVAFVCDYKMGNCSDFHSYIISLARSLKIPAFIEYGFPLTGIPIPNPIPTDGKIGGYHCWMWFKDPERGWLVLDASDGRRWLDAHNEAVKDELFGNLVLERSAVAMSRGRDLVLSPRQQGGPLNNFIYPYAEADGQPVDAKWEFRYHLIGSGSASSSPPARSAQTR